MIWLEIFGYCGTALVLLSMMMTTVTRLRIINMAGSLISAVYAALCNTWPVVLLNVGLMIINAIQLLRSYMTAKQYVAVETDTGDVNVKHFLECYRKDINLFFPDFDPSENDSDKVYVIYDGAEAIGIFIGEESEREMCVRLDYSTKNHRNRSVAKFLFNYLKASGIERIVALPTVEKHNKYLDAMGFVYEDEKMVKTL